MLQSIEAIIKSYTYYIKRNVAGLNGCFNPLRQSLKVILIILEERLQA